MITTRLLAVCLVALAWSARLPAQSDAKIRADIEELRRLRMASKALSFFDGATATQVERWRAAADRGNADGQYLYGIALAFGTHVEKDEAASLRWLRKAAAQGQPLAEYKIGMNY